MIRRPLNIQKKKDYSKKFKQVFETCPEEIIKYLNPKDQQNLMKVCRIAYYFVQSYQVWNMMVYENDKISQASTTDTANNSFVKNSFLQKSRPNSRPASHQQALQREYWLIKPEWYGKKQKELVFLKNKNKIEDNLISDQDLRVTIDIWTVNLAQLQKNSSIELIETDSLIQEITLWTDSVKILDKLKEEFNSDHVLEILKTLKQKSILDVGFERKLKMVMEFQKNLLQDLEEKRIYSQYLSNLKPIFQQFLAIKLGDFNEIQDKFFQETDFMAQKFKYFGQRRDIIYYKIVQLVIKAFNVNVNWIADLQQYETNLSLLEKLQHFISQIEVRQKQTKNGQFYLHYKKGISDIIKMLKLNKKLNESSSNLSIQEMFQYYKGQSFTNFSNREQWGQIYKVWKEKYQHLKSGADDQLNTTNEAISFGFYQTKMSWTIQ